MLAYFMKITMVSKTNLVKKTLLFYSFANLFNIWLNRKHLDSHICLCIQPAVFFGFFF